MSFLDDLTQRPLSATVAGLNALSLFIGPGQLGLEVAVYRAESRPTAKLMQDAWKARQAGRSVPLLTVALFGGRAWLCGPSGEDLPVYGEKDPAAIERLCATALKQPDRHAALLFLSQSLPSFDTVAPGVRNEGLFALHELTQDVPKWPEWPEHAKRAKAVLATGAEGQDLLRRLGFSVERLDNMTYLLKGADRRLGLAVLLDQSEVPEAGSIKFGNLSPVSYALHKASNENLDWVVVLQGDRLRLYPTKGGVGVGRRGPTETYIELQTSVLADEHAGYLSLLFSADALRPRGEVERLLEDSQRFAATLAEDLRDRIYEKVMPGLAQGLAKARGTVRPTVDDLALTYRMALTVLFRLLFVAYAEDRDLLPYRYSEAYRRRSLKQKAQELAEHALALKAPTPGTSHWQEVARIWTAIEVGDDELSVPAYDGGLFTRDPTVSGAGAALATVMLDNSVFEPALRDLLLSDVGDGHLQPVDFRSLGVREFGTIYEGLLESELSVAEQDLAIDAKGSYVPVSGKAQPIVLKGAVYLHDRSGARKSSGSYFTKDFVVEHLLDRALVPALREHLQRVSAMDQASAAEAFFDFRVADIAMGSAHFLVDAIDRIEKAFTGYLAEPQAKGAAGVRQELGRLREAAKAALGEMADEMAFEDSQLLRRLIARRCIYGVDLNPLAVELSRLAIWIHTFVPGLPLSMLDHNLVNGNALVGVGTIAEIRDVFEAASSSLFPVDADNLLSQAQQPLRRLANLADVTLTDVDQARAAMREASVLIGDTKALCDIIAGQRIDGQIQFQFEDWERTRSTIQSNPARHAALSALDGLAAFHFPCAFPEVFLRRRPGFDVLVGNPPWEKSRVEEHEFWARHYPGLRGMNAGDKRVRTDELRAARPDLLRAWERERMESERTRDAVRHIPGMATGHPDLFRAFLWRFTQLVSANAGSVAVVLPGDAFKIKGGASLREDAVHQFSTIEISFLTNKGEWVFEKVHEQKLISLFSATTNADKLISLRLTPECRSPTNWEVKRKELVELGLPWLSRYSSSYVIPTLSSSVDLGLLDRMMLSPRLRDHSEVRVRRVYADFETTRDKKLYHDERAEGDWPVYGGQSFDIWDPDRGDEHYYSWTTPGIMGRADERRLRSPIKSPYGGMPLRWRQDTSTHPIRWPRLLFRDVSNRTNRRTLIVSLAPPNVVTVQSAPWVLFLDAKHDRRQEAYLLGVLSSRICDWWMRRFAEGHVDEEAFNCIRLPLTAGRNELLSRIVSLAGRLGAVDDRFEKWAAEVGVKCGALPPDVKEGMIDELDAVVAHLYGLNSRQVEHLFETFHEGWDFEPHLEAVMRHFTRLSGTR